MRPVFLGQPINVGDFANWVKECMAEIERASNEDPIAVANDFTVENYTETRSLDAATATLADLKDVFCTFIHDLQKRGTKRTE